MNYEAGAVRARDFGPVDGLLRADSDQLSELVLRRNLVALAWCVALIVFGAGAYGAVVGGWRCGLQALYTGVKLPLAILLTTVGNALLNGMLAPLLGLNLSFRQSSVAVLVSFALASLILGALSPVAWFVVWNTPPLTQATRLTSPEYGLLQLTLATMVAGAGITANVRLLPLLRRWTHRPAAARNLLLAWLAVNLFLGSQICWMLRPFIWDPAGQVQFIGQQYLHGSFFETVFEAARRLLFP